MQVKEGGTLIMFLGDTQTEQHDFGYDKTEFGHGEVF